MTEGFGIFIHSAQLCICALGAHFSEGLRGDGAHFRLVIFQGSQCCVFCLGIMRNLPQVAHRLRAMIGISVVKPIVQYRPCIRLRRRFCPGACAIQRVVAVDTVTKPIARNTDLISLPQTFRPRLIFGLTALRYRASAKDRCETQIFRND
jgi:hypothetical protein